jgi:hypothetical protein
VDKDRVVVAVRGVENPRAVAKGGEGSREVDAVQTGEAGTAVEGKGSPGGVAEPEGVMVSWEPGEQQSSSSSVSSCSGGGKGQAVTARVCGEVEVP